MNAAHTNATPATWQLSVWVDNEPNSRWDIIDSDQADADTDPADALANILDREDTPGEYKLTLLDADGVEIASAEDAVKA